MRGFFAPSRAVQACTPRPPTALYAPARAPFLPSHASNDQGFHVVLAFETPFDLSSNCTDAQYSCVLRVDGDGTVQEGSAQQLDANGALYRVWITASNEGTMELMLKEDPCDPNTRPHFIDVQVDWELPRATLLLTGPGPTTTNTSFQVDAFFSEPVLPLGVSSLFTKDAAVIRVQRLSPEHSRFQLEGSVAADAQVWLPSCTDYAGNRGNKTDELEVKVPSKVLKVVTGAIQWGSIATIGASGGLCAATAIALSPGWAGPACVAGILRSFGHLQALAFTRHMAARMPTAYATATGAVEWTRLTWVPEPGTRYANEFSEAADILAADSASTIPVNQLGDGSLLDRTLLSMTAPGAPFIVHAQSDAKASMPSGLSRLGPSLFQSAAAQAQEALAEVVEKAWRDFISCAILTAFVIVLTLGTHLGISRKLHLRLRMDGLQTYAAFPKLTLIGLAAVLPSLLHTAVRVFAWEHAYVSGLNFDLGPGLGALLPAGLLGVIVIAYLTWHSMLGCVYEHQPQEQQAQGGQGGLTGWTEGSRPSSADTDKEWGAIVRAVLGPGPAKAGSKVLPEADKSEKAGVEGWDEDEGEGKGVLPGSKEGAEGEGGEGAGPWKRNGSPVQQAEGQQALEHQQQQQQQQQQQNSSQRGGELQAYNGQQQGSGAVMHSGYAGYLAYQDPPSPTANLPQQQAWQQALQPTVFVPQAQQQQQQQQQGQMAMGYGPFEPEPMPIGYVPQDLEYPSQQNLIPPMPQQAFMPPPPPPQQASPLQQQQQLLGGSPSPYQQLSTAQSPPPLVPAAPEPPPAAPPPACSGAPSNHNPGTPGPCEGAAQQQHLCSREGGYALQGSLYHDIKYINRSSAASGGQEYHVLKESHNRGHNTALAAVGCSMEQPTHGACSRPSRQLPHLPPTPSNSRRWETAAGQSPPNQQYQTPAPSDAEAWVFEGRMCHTATSLVSASAGPVAEGAEGGYVEGGATEGELGPVDNKRKHGRKLRQQQERQEALLLLQQQQQGKEQLEGVEGQQGGKKPKVRASKVRDARVAPPPHITNQMPELDEEKLRHWGALPPEEGKLSPHQEEREQAAREALQFERKPKRTRRAEVVIPSWMETLLPNDKKLWWLANGWLVDDIVHTQRPGQVQAQPSPPRSWLRAWPCLLAHVLFMAHVVALGAVLGAWGPTASSITQLAAAIAIKGAWIQYVITLRPYSSITALVVEPVLGSVELSLLAFALVNNEGTDSVSDPALVAIALLLAAVGIVIILEIGRIIILSLALHKAARERCAEAEERERHHEQQQQQEQQHKQ